VSDLFLNRECSWVDFNLRVLAEAENSKVPLLERLKFLAIVSSNLDEFFMVRVALLKRAIRDKALPKGPDILSNTEALKCVLEKVSGLVKRQYDCLDNEVLPSLEKHGLQIIRIKDYTEKDREFLGDFYQNEVLPVLTPLAIDPGHPFPLLASGSLHILFKLKPQELSESTPTDQPGSALHARYFRQADTVLVQMPSGLKRMVRLPSGEGEVRVALLNDIISLFSDRLLGGYTIEGAYAFRVLRDAEMEVDDEADDLISAVEQELKSRRWGPTVRLDLHSSAPDEIKQYLCEQLDITQEEVCPIPSMLDLKSLFELVGMLDMPKLKDEPWQPQQHPALIGDPDLFAVIREQDILLHHPYQSFDPVVNFINSAADDDKTLAIKITLYRVAGNSPIVRALIRAAEKGKQVTVLVELRARFDEEANIVWARRLDRAGAHVIYGVVGYKTHSKVCLVVRREEDGIRRYVHLATGNYNDKTARLYTDLGLLTARPDIGSDVSGFFNVITGYSLPPQWKRISMAPTGLRRRIKMLIEREIQTHSEQTPGFIHAKMNSLIDPDTIKLLYKASQAGVKIKLLVRGMCRLKAGVPGLSENISVYSVIDRFLEHPRIFHFHNGGNDEVYLASADWMERNFDMRLELLFPVLDEGLVKDVLTVLNTGLSDTVKGWKMLPDGSYVRRTDEPGDIRSQEALYKLACDQLKQNERRRRGGFTPRTNPKRQD